MVLACALEVLPRAYDDLRLLDNAGADQMDAASLLIFIDVPELYEADLLRAVGRVQLVDPLAPVLAQALAQQVALMATQHLPQEGSASFQVAGDLRGPRLANRLRESSSGTTASLGATRASTHAAALEVVGNP